MARGRRSKYEREYHPHQARLLARDGLTDEQIAKKLVIGVATHHRWKWRYPEYRAAVKESKALVDLKVENVLLQRALGFTEEKVEERYNKEGEFIGRRVTRRTMPPNVAAQRLWLRNRQWGRWGDHPEAERGAGPEGIHRFLEGQRELYGIQPTIRKADSDSNGGDGAA